MSVDIDLQRFDHFKDGEFRSIDILSPTEISLTFAVQDAARAHDWITITLAFTGVVDANLSLSDKHAFIDMCDGINIIKDENRFAFGIGECYNIASIKTAPLYIIANAMKYSEGSF